MNTSEHKQTFIQEMKRRGYRKNSIDNYGSCIDVFLSSINKDHPKNVNEQDIKELLGHSSVKTTSIYLHTSHATISRVQSPLNNIKL